MALSIGNKSKNGKDADIVEERLRARLADLEGRLEDGQRVRQLENHIENLQRKHEVELQKARLEAKEQIDRVKGKATAMVKKAKQRIGQQEARYDQLTDDLAELEAAMTATTQRAATLKERGLACQLVVDRLGRSAQEDPREFLAELTRRQREITDQLARLETALENGELEKQATDVELIEHRSKELLSNPELKSKALTVAEKARMFAQDPGKSQYYRELLVPYAKGIQQVLETETRASVVYGCQEALSVVEEAFSDSRTFLLRRSGHLDDHVIEASVTVERIEEAPEDAIGRLQSVLDNARALGPVDFFHNMAQEVARRVERDEKGAKAAAWILSDVTVHVLEDETVRGWLESQT